MTKDEAGLLNCADSPEKPGFADNSGSAAADSGVVAPGSAGSEILPLAYTPGHVNCSHGREHDAACEVQRGVRREPCGACDGWGFVYRPGYPTQNCQACAGTGRVRGGGL